MIDRERWLEALKASVFDETDFETETAGFHIPHLGSLVLHEEESARGEASLMRLVSEEAARDTEELLTQAQRLDDYARNIASEAGLQEGFALPLYASVTPNGRVVANFCACSPFDETDEAVAALHKFLQDNPLDGEVVR